MALSKSPIQTLFPPFTSLVHANRLLVYYITRGFMNGAWNFPFVMNVSMDDPFECRQAQNVRNHRYELLDT